MAADENGSITQTCPACGATIDTTTADPLVRIPCPQCSEKVKVERSFNNFVIVETVGIGGMGTVYKARDTLLDRFVALKLLRKDLGSDEIDYGKRLQQEARVAASVNHPNVIQVYSSGTDHGQFYLVMELVDHGSLDDFIEQRKNVAEEQVLQTGIQVAKGLRAAYAKGLIHRDVKPANILFADEQTAKIGDFGLAGAAAEGAENRGEIWGTPYYVAPERLDNKPEDFRSDIYSLGATLFHALSGKAPIEGDTNSAVALRELKNRPVNLEKVVPNVNPATAEVLGRMIAPDPENRFSSYDELVADLEKAERTVTGKEDGGAKVWRLGLIIAGLLVALLVASFLLFFRKPPPAPAGAMASHGAAGIPTSELERQFNDARKQLLAGKYNVAHAEFARIAGDAKGRQPLYDWVRLNQGLAATIGREQSQARQAFQEVENAGQTNFKKEEADLARFFVTTAKNMSSQATIPASAGNVQHSDGYEALALFLYALKDMSQSDVSDANTLLEKFVAAQPQGKFAWIAEYRPLAQKYLDDCRLYSVWKSQAKDGQNAAELSASLEALRSIKKKLKTRTALSDEINAQEKNLARRVTEQQKLEGATRDQERKKLAEVELPAWNAILANYRQKVATYDFTGALETIKAAKVSEPSLSQAKAATEKKANWLIEWKKKLIDDLNRSRFSGPFADVSNVQYTGVMGAKPDRLVLKNPYGTLELPWTKLSAPTLLMMSRSFATPTAPDVADRLWLCAVLAAETGQADAARQLGEAAAKAKPQYQEQLPLLSPPPPAR